MLPADREPPTAPPAARRSAPQPALHWFSPAYAPDAAVVRRGQLEVHIGAGLMLASTVALCGTMLAVAPAHLALRVAAAGAGALVWQGILTAGLLVGSRLARGIVLASGFIQVLVAAGRVATLRQAPHPFAFRAAVIAGGIGALAYATGASLTTLAPAARVWHGVQDAARKVKRKAKSLADWRRAQAP